MIIAVDFDGTVVTHDYPNVGRDVKGAKEVLGKLLHYGHKIILYTMRSNMELHDATEWFALRGIPLWGVNTNPEQRSWTDSPKPYAHLYIDDAALGCPLINRKDSRPYVNWRKVDKWLSNHGYYQGDKTVGFWNEYRESDKTELEAVGITNQPAPTPFITQEEMDYIASK